MNIRRRGTTLIAALMLTMVPWSLYCGQEQGTKEKPVLDVPYEPTTYGIAEAMLSMANVTSRDLVYDLGCGDGRIVIMAAKERGAQGVGVDIDPARIKESRENAKAEGVSGAVRFFEQSLFETDITDATVVMLYLWPEVNLKLRPKLLRDLKPGTRIVSHSHTMGDWQTDDRRTVENHNLYLFTVPLNVSGRWQWIGRDGGPVTLRLTQKFQKVQGSVRFSGREIELIDCALRGKGLSFSVKRTSGEKKEILFFEGRVSGDAIEGTITEGTGGTVSRWNAVRDASTVVSIAQ